MRTNIILSSILVVALGVVIQPALAAEAAEGGMSLINKTLLDWKIKDVNKKDTWRLVADVKLDANDPKKLVATGDAAGDHPVLFRQPIKSGSDIYTERDFGDCELHVEFVVPKS